MKINSVYKKGDKFGVITGQAPIENLVFEGGGPKGLVYVGAADVLEKKGVLETVKNVGGSSAGAMTALAIGLGYNAKNIKEIVWDVDLNDFKDILPEEKTGIWGWFSTVKGAIENLSFKTEDKGRGLFLGEKLENWAKHIIQQRIESAYEFAKESVSLSENSDAKIIEAILLKKYFPSKLFSSYQQALEEYSKGSKQWQKVVFIREIVSNKEFKKTLAKRYEFVSELRAKNGGILFSEYGQLRNYFPELELSNICFTGTNYTDQKLEIFSEFTTPSMPVATAVRISMSLPWVFKSVIYNGKEYVDGGVLNNYPMSIFDSFPYFEAGINLLTTGALKQNLSTLGFRVDSDDEIKNIFWNSAKQKQPGILEKISNEFWGAYYAFRDTVLVGVDTQAPVENNRMETYEKYSHLTVQINDKEYSTYNFDLDESDKKILQASGEASTAAWFDLYYDGSTGIEIEVNKPSDLLPHMSVRELEQAKKQFPEYF